VRIVVAASLIDQLVHAAASAPMEEVCGLLFGEPGRIVEARPAANVAPDRTASFEVDPAALFAAFRAERVGGPRLIGHYHSHPNGLAEPSQRDLAAAEPGRIWLIIGGATVRAWLATAGDFHEITLLTD